MANNTTVQSSYSQENSEADECCENIPPEITASAGKLKINGYYCAQPSGEKSLTDTGTSDVYSIGRLLAGKTASVSLLEDEYLPEITLLDVTCDPTSVPATPVTARPVSCTLTTQQRFHLSSSKATGQVGSLSKTITETSFVVNRNDITSDSFQKSSGRTILGETASTSFFLQNNTLHTKSPYKQSGTSESTVSKLSSPEIRDGFTKAKDNNSEILPLQLSKRNGTTPIPKANVLGTPVKANAPVCWLYDEYFPEITLLDVTHDSELSSGGKIFNMEATADTSPVDELESDTPTLKVSGPALMDPCTPDISGTTVGDVIHTTYTFSVQSENCVGENGMKASLTQDISVESVLENSGTSAKPSEQNNLIQPSAEDTPGTQPANVTRDINSSSDASSQSGLSQISASDGQCDISSKTVTSEIHGEPVAEKNEELLTTTDTEVTSKVLEPNPASARSSNSTFTAVPPVGVSPSTSSNSSTEEPTQQNKTLDLYPSDLSSIKVGSDPKEQASSVEVCAATFCLQNNTFDSKPLPKQNNTITLSETSSSDNHQNTSVKPSPKACDPASSPKDVSKVQPPEPLKHNSTDPNAKMGDMPESTFEVSPVVEIVPESGQHESGDHLKPSQTMTDGLSDSLGHESIDTGNNNANTFNLDDTLDLKIDYLVTSTPMPDCKISLCVEREEGKPFPAQKKLYVDGPGKPVIQMQSSIPSNIVCDRKTFLTQPIVKPLLIPLKAASQLLKYKRASAIPGRCEPSTSGLSRTRQRTQAESVRITAAPDAALVVGCSVYFFLFLCFSSIKSKF